MKTQQKAFVVRVHEGRTDGLDALNTALGQGWRVVETTPLGGGGEATWGAALVVVERAPTEAAAALVQEAEEEVEELIGETGDGAEVELSDDVGPAAEPPETPGPPRGRAS